MVRDTAVTGNYNTPGFNNAEYDALIDENAASHLALGRAYKFTLKDGKDLNDEEFQARGGNVSRAHVEFMVGSGQMDIDGTTADGTVEPVMRQGEWAFDV